MTAEERIFILDGAKSAFFETMLDGYAGEDRKHSTKTTSPDGYTKTITFKCGDYTVIDEYRVTPWSDYSAGTTTIFYQGIPVWWMSYGGFYEPQAIPFLKVTLAKNYREGVFFGGRGKSVLVDHGTGMVYFNTATLGTSGSFENFVGEESIHTLSTGQHLGFHRYFGMSLI